MRKQRRDEKKTIKTPTVHDDEPSSKTENEGEGSYTATRAYDKDVRDFVKSGNVDASARVAAEAIDGPEGAQMKTAELRSKRGKA